MKFHISSIEMNNYRQYYGKNVISFTNDPEKNVCLIHGRNGAGKSNLLNAITWGLYGIEAHKQNDPSRSDGMPLVNTHSIEELSPGRITSAEVVINLTANGSPWRIKRSLEIGKSALGVVEKNYTEGIQVVYAENGQNKIVDTEDAQILINNLLPPALRNFFFIDGEQLREFFKVSSKKKVTDAIDQVSQLDLLYKVAQNLGYAETKLRKSIKGSNPNIQKIEEKIEIIESKIESVSSDIRIYEDKIDTLEIQREDIEEYLKTHSDEKVSLLANERDRTNLDIITLNKKIETAIQERNDYLAEIAPFIYLKDCIDKSYTIIQDKVEKGILPPKIRESLIADLLEAGTCICGTSLTQETRKNLVEYAKTLQYSEYAEKANEGKIYINSIHSKIEEFPNKIDRLNQNINEIEENLAAKSRRVEQISEEIEDFDVEEIRLKEKRFKELNNSIAKNKQIVVGKNGELVLLTSTKNEYLKEWEQAAKNETKFKELKGKLDIVEKAQQTLSNTEKIIKTRIRNQVETNTERNFHALIRKKEAFSKVEINEDYQVRINHKDGYNVINDLSAGEYMILGLSFMSSLMTISGFQAPVIIDTPLGKIDDEHRDYITNTLPKFLHGTQLILLVTPTEYDAKVKENLSKFVLDVNNYQIVENQDNTNSGVEQYGI